MYLEVFSFKLRAAWSDLPENYISGAQNHNKHNLHVCILYILYIPSKKKINDLIVFAATFEITQDALCEYKTLHFDVFLLNIHRFKLRKR